jgi:orotate phosphoribosyltransferase
MTPGELLSMLKSDGAVINDDHLVLTSGMHSSGYVNFRCYYEADQAHKLEALCNELALKFEARADIDVVLGPARGGGLIADGVARALSRIHGRDVKAITAYKLGGEKKDFFLKEEDLAFLPGKKILVVDDVLTTGSSVDPVFERLLVSTAEIIGLALFANRSGLGAERFGIPLLIALIELTIPVWTPEQCRADGPCGRGQPINTKIGHGKQYVAEHGQPQTA